MDLIAAEAGEALGCTTFKRWVWARPPSASPAAESSGRSSHSPRRSCRVRWPPNVGAVIFSSLAVFDALSTALYIFCVVTLGGMSTSAVWYLIVERVMRPISAHALSGGAPERRVAFAERPGLTLKGKSNPVQIYAPA